MTKSLPYQVIIFDWDGTIVDTEAFIIRCMENAAKDVELPSPTTEAVKSIIGLSVEIGLPRLFPDAGKTKLLAMREAYRKRYFEEKPKTEAFDGVLDALQTLRDAGYWLAVATGKGRRGLDQDIDDLGLQEIFMATRTASETLSKPNPEMLFEILDELGLEASQALMIGDTGYDLDMAKAADMDAVGVTCGVCDEAQLAAFQTVGVLTSVKALPDWLQKRA